MQQNSREREEPRRALALRDHGVGRVAHAGKSDTLMHLVCACVRRESKRVRAKEGKGEGGGKRERAK